MESCIYDSITPSGDELIMKKDYVVKLKVKEALENRELSQKNWRSCQELENQPSVILFVALVQ